MAGMNTDPQEFSTAHNLFPSGSSPPSLFQPLPLRPGLRQIHLALVLLLLPEARVEFDLHVITRSPELAQAVLLVTALQRENLLSALRIPVQHERRVHLDRVDWSRPRASLSLLPSRWSRPPPVAFEPQVLQKERAVLHLLLHLQVPRQLDVRLNEV